MLSVVAYAEIRAIWLAWAGTRSWNPAMRARAAVARALAEGVAAVELADRAQQILRGESHDVLLSANRRTPPWPFDQTIGCGQIGTTDGLEQIVHAAGKIAGAYRGNDVRCLALAVSLSDFVRSYDQRAM